MKVLGCCGYCLEEAKPLCHDVESVRLSVTIESQKIQSALDSESRVIILEDKSRRVPSWFTSQLWAEFFVCKSNGSLNFSAGCSFYCIVLLKNGQMIYFIYLFKIKPLV